MIRTVSLSAEANFNDGCYFREHIGFQVYGPVHHAPAGATVAHLAALAAKGDQLGMPTRPTLQLQAAVLQNAARQPSIAALQATAFLCAARFRRGRAVATIVATIVAALRLRR